MLISLTIAYCYQLDADWNIPTRLLHAKEFSLVIRARVTIGTNPAAEYIRAIQPSFCVYQQYSTTIMGSATEIPNAKKDQEIPDWNLTELDRMLLRQTDEEYEPHSWDELKWIISMYCPLYETLH
jgi:hypothetical protein